MDCASTWSGSGANAVAVNTPPPLYRDQRAVDREHLSLLSVFHYVVAGFAFSGLGFLLLHYMMFSTFLNNPDMWKGAPGAQGPPVAQFQQFFAVFKWFYVFGGACLIAAAVANLVSGLFIRARKNRMFSLVVAALNCIQVPFGTVLGVFTIIVLVRESVREVYDRPATMDDEG
jgi:hypothetical protein